MKWNLCARAPSAIHALAVHFVLALQYCPALAVLVLLRAYDAQPNEPEALAIAQKPDERAGMTCILL